MVDSRKTKAQLTEELEALRERVNALEKAEGRHRALFEGIADGVIIHDPDGRILDANRVTCARLGYDLEELRGMFVRDIIGPEFVDQVGQHVNEALQGKTVRFETAYRARDGRSIPCEVLERAVDRQDGVVLQSVARDIGEWRETVKALGRNEWFYRTSIHAAGAVPYCRDYATNTYEFVGDHIRQLTGYAADEFTPKVWDEIILQIVPTGEYAGMTYENAKKIAQREHRPVWTADYRIRTRQGEERWLASAAADVRNEEGEPIRSVGMLTDITEHKRVVQTIRESERFFASTLDDLVTFVAVLKPDGEILFVNNAPLKLIGKSLEQVRGMKFYDVDWWTYSKDAQRLIRNDLARCAAGEKIHREVQVETHQGRIWVDFSVHPVLGEDGCIQYLIPEGRDVTTRKQAEEALREKTRQMEFILGAAKTGLDIIDSRYNLRYVDPEWMKTYGDWAGRKCYEYFMGRDTPCPTCGIPHALRTKQISVTEEILVKENNRPVQVTTLPYQDKSGEWLVAEVNTDISERKQAEYRERLARQVLDLLNRSEEATDTIRDILRRIKDSMDFDAVGIRLREGDDFPYYEANGFSDAFLQAERYLCERDAAGNIVRNGTGSPVLECMCGSVIRGRTDPTLPFFTEGGSFWTNSTTQLLASTTEKERQARTRNRCNSEGYESLALIPLRSGGETIGLLQLNDRRPDRFTEGMIHFFEGLGASIGIALSRKRTEQATRESESKYRTLFEGSIEAISVTQDGKLTDVNPAWLALHGYDDKEEVIGRDVLDIIHPDDRHILIDRRADPRARRGTGYELRDLHKDGSVREVEVYSTTISLAGREAILTTLRDVSERHRLQEQLLRAQKMEGLGTLAGGVAHNFNNILGIILGNAELAQMDLGDSHPAAEFVDKIINATKRAAGLAQQLLSVARRRPVERTVIDSSELVQNVAQAMEVMLDSSIQINRRIAPDLPSVMANQAELEQVLINICLNARDAMPKGGVLTIDATAVELDHARCEAHENMAPGAHVCIAITDTGTGMAPDILARIFDPFFTTKGPDKGTGLGLSVAYGTVASHGGCLEVESERGKGSTFRVYLPAAQGASTAAPRPKAHEMEGGTETILVVDDEEEIVCLAFRTLESLGYTVLTAANGKEAVELYRQDANRIHLVLLDCVMPVMDGEDAYRELKAINPAVKVLVASGYDEQGKVKPLLDAGIDGFLPKPYLPHDLSHSVRKILEKE